MDGSKLEVCRRLRSPYKKSNGRAATVFAVSVIEEFQLGRPTSVKWCKRFGWFGFDVQECSFVYR